MRLVLGAAGLAAAFYVALAAGAYLFQARLIYFPAIGRDDPTTPARLGLPFEDLRLVTADGEIVHAWYVPSPAARGTALFFHGNAGSIAQRIAWLPMLRQLGLNTLLLEYRGYGASSGTPSEAGMYRDAEAAWTHLMAARGSTPEDIVIVGESLGAAVAVQLAQQHAPGALVVISGFTSVPDLAADLYPYLPARALARFDYDSRSRIGSVTCPVFIAHSPDDEVIPYAHGRRLFEAAPEPKEFLELSGGHNEGALFLRQEWVAELSAFLNAHWRAGR